MRMSDRYINRLMIAYHPQIGSHLRHIRHLRPFNLHLQHPTILSLYSASFDWIPMNNTLLR